MDEFLNVLGQQPGLNLRTQICLCYRIQNESQHFNIISTLTNGLERLTESFPWVAGQVIREGQIEGNTGIFKIGPLDKTPRLVVKDLRDDSSLPSMDALREAKFPFRLLDESAIAPLNTVPGSSGEPPAKTVPVFIVQANFVIGGLILTIDGQHQTMDMTGQGQVITLLSKACHGTQFTAEEVRIGNLPRQDLIPYLDGTYRPGAELSRQMVKEAPSKNDGVNGKESSSVSWTYFSFSPSSLDDLKSTATKALPSGFVSTDDTLTAFLWQGIMRARLPRLDSSTVATLGRAVDVRRFLGVPATYTGLLQNMTYHTYTLRDLVDAPLGIVAAELRSVLDLKTSTLAHDTRALATVLDRSPDKTILNFAASLDLSVDIMLSSWAKLDSYELDFNLGLGKPEAVRRPQFVPVESLLYLLPRRPDGEIVAAMALREEDYEHLKADEAFTKYATCIP